MAPSHIVALAIALFGDPAEATSRFVSRHHLHQRHSRRHGKFELSQRLSRHGERWAERILTSGQGGGESGSMMGRALGEMSDRVDLRAAAALAQQKKHLPPEVSSLVQQASKGKLSGMAGSTETARKMLNSMVEKAWGELDDKIMHCQALTERNRAVYEQVQSDLSQLGSELAESDKLKGEAADGIGVKDQEVHEAEEQLAAAHRDYLWNLQESNEEKALIGNDVRVYELILAATKCSSDGALLFIQHGKGKVGDGIRVCHLQDGQPVIRFSDPNLQKKIMGLQSLRSRKQILTAFSAFQATNEAAMAAREEPAEESEDSNETIVVTAAPPTPFKLPPAEGCQGDSCYHTCSPIDVDCTVMYDKMSLLWGQAKDALDEVNMDASKSEYIWHDTRSTLNGQIEVLRSAKAQYGMQLPEASSDIAANQAEQGEKRKQKRELDKEHTEHVTRCKKDISRIMYQDMCSLIVIRNAMLADSDVCSTDTVQDCEVDDFIGEECSLTCDDKCPDPHNQLRCGGWQAVTRKIVTPPNECGVKCPALKKERKCGQVKCPIDCQMSAWSGWSKCTKDCEGGVRLRTRSILTKPKHGGEACDVVGNTEPCNSGSCNRNCVLSRWSSLSPCSVACGGGVQEAVRHVLVPIRGLGRCPTAASFHRYRSQSCNTHSCVGDEICVAQQDLVIAVDGSGSLSEEGFAKVKTFASKLVERYQAEYFSDSAMRIGVLQFGNGEVLEGGVVAQAIKKQDLTEDMAAAKAAVDGMTFLKGFTNMAQAFALAERMFTLHSRRGAQHAVLVITDGQPSFEFQTKEMVSQLDDKGIMRFFAVVQDFKGDELEKMASWASQPSDTNLVHIPGIKQLGIDVDAYVEKALTKFCPMAISPSQMQVEEKSVGYMQVKDGGWCGDQGDVLSSKADTVEMCASLAAGAGATSFLKGVGFRDGYCYAGTMDVTGEQFTAWADNRATPECPTEWHNSAMYDFYAMQPATE